MHMKRFSLLSAVVGFTALTVVAAPPTGSFTHQFSTNEAPLWDLTGVIPLEQTVIGTAGVEIPVAFGVLVDQDNRGRLRGTGGAVVVIGADTVTGQYRATGRIWTSGGVVRAKLTVKLNGKGEIAGQATTFRISAVHHFDLNADELQLDGRVNGSARFAKLVNGPIRGDSVSPLAEGNDGSWTLTLEIVPLKRLGGSATATLVSGRVCVFNLKGSHSASSDTSRIKLSGVGAARKLRFDLRTRGEDLELIELKGKALGQNLKYRPDTAPK
jgi:hypothetical protein